MHCIGSNAIYLISVHRIPIIVVAKVFSNAQYDAQWYSWILYPFISRNTTSSLYSISYPHLMSLKKSHISTYNIESRVFDSKVSEALLFLKDSIKKRILFLGLEVVYTYRILIIFHHLNAPSNAHSNDAKIIKIR